MFMMTEESDWQNCYTESPFSGQAVEAVVPLFRMQRPPCLILSGSSWRMFTRRGNWHFQRMHSVALRDGWAFLQLAVFDCCCSMIDCWYCWYRETHTFSSSKCAMIFWNISLLYAVFLFMWKASLWWSHVHVHFMRGRWTFFVRSIRRRLTGCTAAVTVRNLVCSLGFLVCVQLILTRTRVQSCFVPFLSVF